MVLVLLGFIIGSVLGSFAKALADRSLKSSTFKGRSYCESCKKTLRWYDLFPILSFVFLGGKCRYCKKPIGLEYILVEVVMGIIIGYLFSQVNFQFPIYNFQLIFELIFKTFFITVLATIFLTDIKEMFIPDRIVIPASLIALVALLSITIYKIIILFQNLSADPIGKYLLPGNNNDYFLRHALLLTGPFLTAVISALAIGGFFAALVFGTKGRGMGGGDIKLGAFMGLGLGFPGGVMAVIIAFITGAIVALVAVVMRKKGLKSQIPFGPFLIFGSLIVLFWGQQLLNWYMKFGT
jgi:prepilin signal peptidase PulO-like enzyme (type II secretory pathway)